MCGKIIQLTMNIREHSTPSLEGHSDFFKKSLSLVLKAAFQDTDRSAPVIRWRSPQQLKEILPLSLSNDGVDDEELLKSLEEVIKFSAKTGHPHFVNQLFSGLDPYGLVGQLITDALNPSVYTYEVAPVFTLMEDEVISSMLKLVGFKNGEGLFCPGGSMANGFAINLARHSINPQIKIKGLSTVKRLVLFASEDAHYSVHKMAAFLGLGENSVVSIATDEVGRMDSNQLEYHLERVKEEGSVPFMIFATAGTTVLGAFDPLKELAGIAQRNGLWLHVDAAWGGGLLFSELHSHLLDGISSADSVTWNPHKLLAVPQQCSVLLLRKKGLLLDCHGRNADYLFQKDKFYDTDMDVGDRHLQCGRRADVLKFWLMWKAKGSSGFSRHVDHLMEMSRLLLSEVKARPHFTLVSSPQFINVCFWYIPDKLQPLRQHPDYFQMLHKVAPKIKEGMLRRGSMMINYQPLRNLPNFFRFVAQNSAINRDDIRYFLNEIERLGEEI